MSPRITGFISEKTSGKFEPVALHGASGSDTHDTRFRIQDTVYRIQDTGYRIEFT